MRRNQRRLSPIGLLAVILLMTNYTLAASQFKILHSFKNDGTDGNGPTGSVVFDPAGNQYSTTEAGGAYGKVCRGGCGTVF